jgi:putative ABC transport system ATP-binding protein
VPLIIRGDAKRTAHKRASELLEQLGLERRLNARPAEMSGGEQQRVAIARALVTEPKVLLADEPTGNLDTKTGVAVLDLLEELNRERGVALVIVTHDLDVAARARTRITMRDGVVVEPS